jgi:hypothetical protein
LQKENGREYDKGAIDNAHDRAHPSTACQRGAEKPKEIPEVYNGIVSSLVGIPEVNFQLTRPC